MRRMRSRRRRISRALPWTCRLPPLLGALALADQQMAGLIMWIPMGTVYLAAAALLAVSVLDAAPARAL